MTDDTILISGSINPIYQVYKCSLYNSLVCLQLTSVSLVYTVDPLVDWRAALLLRLEVCLSRDQTLSGTKGLISELKPEKHSLPLRYCS